MHSASQPKIGSPQDARVDSAVCRPYLTPKIITFVGTTRKSIGSRLLGITKSLLL